MEAQQSACKKRFERYCQSYGYSHRWDMSIDIVERTTSCSYFLSLQTHNATTYMSNTYTEYQTHRCELMLVRKLLLPDTISVPAEDDLKHFTEVDSAVFACLAQLQECR